MRTTTTETFADAVVYVRFETSEISGASAEMLANGTVVTLE